MSVSETQKPFIHASIDLETLDTVPSAVILSAGIVFFDWRTAEVVDSLYAVFDTPSQAIAKRTISPSTAKWWMEQSPEARAVLSAVQQPVNEALDIIDGAFKHYAPAGVWGNGADFDCVLLGELYRSFGREKPWSYGKNRCLRTLKNMVQPRTIVMPDRVGTHHNALDDALYQARLVTAICKANDLSF
jgi:hypothetical protein